MSVTIDNLSLHYSEDELATVVSKKIPEHVAIIMDGNRRWAEKHHNANDLLEGHTAGAQQPRIIAEAALQLGIKTLTFFAFSTENKQRSSREISHLFDLLIAALQKERLFFQKNGIRFDAIGNITLLPKKLVEEIKLTKTMTQSNNKFNIVLAVNYGGRDEIVRATQQILIDAATISPEPYSITEEKFASFLDTTAYGDPDLLIRTSGEMRVSNFLLWQIAYTELFFTEKLWPDFSPQDLLIAVQSFQKRNRRQGL